MRIHRIMRETLTITENIITIISYCNQRIISIFPFQKIYLLNKDMKQYYS